jgi:hypothetical protein
MPVSENQRKEWARRGAAAQLQELELQRRAILEEFPELASSRHAGSKKRSRTLSPAHRRALSEGMRKHWMKLRSKSN